jgi:hypothetical protein
MALSSPVKTTTLEAPAALGAFAALAPQAVTLAKVTAIPQPTNQPIDVLMSYGPF